MLSIEQLDRAAKNYYILLTDKKYFDRYGNDKIRDMLKSSRALALEYRNYREFTDLRWQLSDMGKHNIKPTEDFWRRYNFLKKSLEESHTGEDLKRIDDEIPTYLGTSEVVKSLGIKESEELKES